MLASAFSFVMLGFGGAGGLINMSYQLDATIHNTQWVTGHFHLIFAGAIVIMYFAIAYDLWPHLTGRALTDLALMRAQLWLWFVGMIVTTFPWHWVGILGMPRRMAYFDYSSPALSADAFRSPLRFRRIHPPRLWASVSGHPHPRRSGGRGSSPSPIASQRRFIPPSPCRPRSTASAFGSR